MNSRDLFEMTNRFNLNKILTKQITDLEIGIPYQVLSIKSANSGCLYPCLVQLGDTITDEYFEVYLLPQYSVLPSFMRLNSVYMTYHGMEISYKEEQYPHLTFNNINTSTREKKQDIAREKNNFLGKRGHEKRLEFFNKNRFKV